MRLQHGKAIHKDDRLKFQKRSGDLHDFAFAKMIKYMLKRAREKLEEKREAAEDEGTGKGGAATTNLAALDSDSDSEMDDSDEES